MIGGLANNCGCRRTTNQLSTTGQSEIRTVTQVQRVEVAPWWIWLVVAALVLKLLEK